MIEERELKDRMNKYQTKLVQELRAKIGCNLKQGELVAQLKEKLEKSERELEYIRKNRSVYNKDQVEEWRKDAEVWKNEVQSYKQGSWQMLADLERAEKNSKSIGEREYQRGVLDGKTTAFRIAEKEATEFRESAKEKDKEIQKLAEEASNKNHGEDYKNKLSALKLEYYKLMR